MADQTREADDSGFGDQARTLREDLSPDRLNSRLEEVIEERPKTRYLLDFGIVAKALLAAVVVTVVLALVFSTRVAALGLVIVFFGGWLIGAQVTYDRRRGTRDVRDDDSGDEDAAQGSEEQDDDEDTASRNGSRDARATAKR